MKKKLMQEHPAGIPPVIEIFAGGSEFYDASSPRGSKVYYIERDTGYYLKQAAKGALEKEAKMTAYFHEKGIGAEVLTYISDEEDWLLTAALPGNDGVQETYFKEAKRLCDTLAQELRKLHETDFTGCPVPDRTAEYVAQAEQNYQARFYRRRYFPNSYGYRTADEAYEVLTAGKDALQSRVLLHGDYCLPNIILNDWEVSGFIDVGSGGVGDRHIDLFWGLWTLWRNLRTNKFCDRFLDAYGRDKADAPLLKIVAAAEVFY